MEPLLNNVQSACYDSVAHLGVAHLGVPHYPENSDQGNIPKTVQFFGLKVIPLRALKIKPG